MDDIWAKATCAVDEAKHRQLFEQVQQYCTTDAHMKVCVHMIIFTKFIVVDIAHINTSNTISAHTNCWCHVQIDADSNIQCTF
jgi:hypothetical protein